MIRHIALGLLVLCTVVGLGGAAEPPARVEEDEAIAEIPPGLLALLDRAGVQWYRWGDWPYTENGGIAWGERGTEEYCGYETWPKGEDGQGRLFCGDY